MAATPPKAPARAAPWKPGQSGNVLGRPKGAAGFLAEIRKAVGDSGELIVETMREIMTDPKTPKRDRIECAKWFADRAVGKAPDLAVTIDATAQATLGGLPDQDLGTFVRDWLSTLPGSAKPLAEGQIVDGQAVPVAVDPPGATPNPLSPLPK